MKLKVDTKTGELLPAIEMVESSKAPAIIIDISEVSVYHKTPLELAKKIEDQAGFMVFDVNNKSGRDACRSHSANIIKCISPALNESRRLASEAQKIIKQDLYFRKTFEDRVREIAEFHRKPLTEYEDHQKQLEEERLAEEQRIKDELQYQSDWQDALDFDELYQLRKIKRLEEERLETERKEAFKKQQFENELKQRIEQERETIRKQEEDKVRKELFIEQQRIESERKELLKVEEVKRPITVGVIETQRKPNRRSIIYYVSLKFNLSLQDAEQLLIREFSNA
jgi:hypothetical protein